jgi:hypothetical protein
MGVHAPSHQQHYARNAQQHRDRGRYGERAADHPWLLMHCTFASGLDLALTGHEAGRVVVFGRTISTRTSRFCMRFASRYAFRIAISSSRTVRPAARTGIPSGGNCTYPPASTCTLRTVSVFGPSMSTKIMRRLSPFRRRTSCPPSCWGGVLSRPESIASCRTTAAAQARTKIVTNVHGLEYFMASPDLHKSERLRRFQQAPVESLPLGRIVARWRAGRSARRREGDIPNCRYSQLFRSVPCSSFGSGIL